MRMSKKTRQRGQGMTEYIIIVALIAIGAIFVVTVFSDNIRALFGSSANALQGQSTSTTDLGGTEVGEDDVKRDLKTFHTTLQHTLDLRPRIPADRLVVGESGIRDHQDLLTLGQGGVKAVLVGESLMRQDDIEQATRRLLRGAERNSC